MEKKHLAIDATAHLARTYATDPNYATKLNQLIKHYHLTDFDHKTTRFNTLQF